MNILGKKHEYQLLRLVSYGKSGDDESFILDRKKILVGTSDSCDITLKDGFCSHYHAIIFIEESGGRIVDLESVNGVYLNGRRIKENFLGSGDVLKLGETEFHIEDFFHDKELLDPDKKEVTNITQEKIDNYIPQEKPSGNLVLIDGEYCDIVFDEHGYKPLESIPLSEDSGHFGDYNNYVDTNEKKNFHPLADESENLAVQVITLSSGNIMSMDYFPMNNSTLFVSNRKNGKRTILLETLETADKMPFIDISGGQIKLWDLKNFNSKNLKTENNDLFNNNETIELEKDDVISFTQATVQILVQMTDAPPRLRKVPFFGRDKEFFKRTGIVFAFYAILWLILSFLINVDDINRDPEKKIAVVYRKAVRSEVTSDMRSSGEKTVNQENKGVVENKMPKKPIKEAKAGETRKVTKQQEAAKKRVTTTSKTIKKAKPKIKTYNFKMANNLTSMLNSTTSVNDVKINNNNDVISNDGLSNSVSDTGDLKGKMKKRIGNLGSSLNGKFNTTSGAKGLGSKKGIDTTYVEPKTVVLGSMDPELIRKILREYLPQFQHCYQQELLRNEKIKGVIKLDFRIAQNGKVSKVAIKGRTRFSRPGRSCMVSVMKMIQFPKPKGGGVVDVTQPLNFFSERVSGR
ncbi:MAG: AgmX/PglI C-terminal domain-containing protein [Bacteriovoracaceae bacterium]|nr:AgmX/PglI C-terminal domain-containing protein [Bacteriovoracaceae bacterium]